MAASQGFSFSLSSSLLLPLCLNQKTCPQVGIKKNKKEALAGVAQGFECRFANQRVANSILSQGTCLGCGPGPQWGPHERQAHIDIFLSLVLPPFTSIKINK